jgi:hypothetical protein
MTDRHRTKAQFTVNLMSYSEWLKVQKESK